MSSTKRFEPGDVKLVSVKIVNTNKTATADLKAMLLTASIYEDLEEPTVYAELVINDGLNLVKDFPIIGEEDIEISFVTPGRENITTYKLRTFAVDGTKISENNQTSNYTIKCVSHEHFTNATRIVDKIYSGTIGEMVLDIFSNELNVTKDITVESTRGLTPIAIPQLTPFSAIDYLRKRAVAKRPSGGVYVFFENQYGYNFITLEKLIEDGKNTINTRVFTHAPDTKSDTQREAYAWRNIQRIEHLTKFDTISKMQSGLFKNQVKSFDMVSKIVSETNFNLTEQSGAFETGEKKAKLTNTEKITNEAYQGAPKYMFAPKDSSKGNDYVTDLMGYKLAFASMFNQNLVRCEVYGDNYLAAGEMVQLNLPEPSSTTEKKVGDTRFSGNYMITKLRHIIYQSDAKFKHNITMDCNKIGFNS